MLHFLRNRNTDSVRVLSLALSLLVGACDESTAPIPAGDGEDEDDGTTMEPTTVEPDDDAAGEPVDDDTPSTPPAMPKPDGGKAALDGGTAGPGKPSLDASSELDPVVDVDVSGDASTPVGDGGFVAPWVTREDLGKGDGKDVVCIGDSWMAGALNGAGIQAGLDRAGTNYRQYGVTATTLLSGQIPGQYDRAKRADPKISTVIMTGGGNDVMFSGGACNTPEKCAEFGAEILAGLNKLWTQMADDGVKDVIYIQYSDSAGSTPSDSRGATKASAPICTSGRISCHSVPTTDIITRADLADGIHPGRAGNDRIAKRVLELMEMRKIRR